MSPSRKHRAQRGAAEEDRQRLADRAIYNLKHEREGGQEEIEFQVKWKRQWGSFCDYI